MGGTYSTQEGRKLASHRSSFFENRALYIEHYQNIKKFESKPSFSLHSDCFNSNSHSTTSSLQPPTSPIKASNQHSRQSNDHQAPRSLSAAPDTQKAPAMNLVFSLSYVPPSPFNIPLLHVKAPPSAYSSMITRNAAPPPHITTGYLHCAPLHHHTTGVI